VHLLNDVVNIKSAVARTIIIILPLYLIQMCHMHLLYSFIAADATSMTSWAYGTNTAWPQVKKGFRSVAPEFGGLVETSSRQVCAAVCTCKIKLN